MTKQEFESLYGEQVSDERFEKINEIYMATMYEKNQFVELYKNNRDAIDVDLLSAANVYKGSSRIFKQEREDLFQIIVDLVASGEFTNEHERTLCKVFGDNAGIILRLKAGVELSDKDKETIINKLS
jgi:hypothetical protein